MFHDTVYNLRFLFSKPAGAEKVSTSREEEHTTVTIQGLGLKPKVAFGPVRVAVSGRRVSPPLFESLEILGRDRTLARLRSAG